MAQGRRDLAERKAGDVDAQRLIEPERGRGPKSKPDPEEDGDRARDEYGAMRDLGGPEQRASQATRTWGTGLDQY